LAAAVAEPASTGEAGRVELRDSAGARRRLPAGVAKLEIHGGDLLIGPEEVDPEHQATTVADGGA
jgi:hypothetical protein